MIIRKRKIRKVENYLNGFAEGCEITVALTDIESHRARLTKCGFDAQFQVGDRVCPAAVFGPMSKFNSEGKDIVRKDLPMETAHRLQDWSVTDWHGQEHSGTAYVQYQRYPRERIAPLGYELTVMENAMHNELITSEFIAVRPENMDAIKMMINLFLELFGECEILTHDLVPNIRGNIRRIQWEMIPPGAYPWERIRGRINAETEHVRRNRRAMMSRFETINSYAPNCVAVGRAGFKGYVAFCFSNKNINILESIYSDNATYIFDDNWERLTQLTKKEIITENLARARVVHNQEWEQQIMRLLR